MAAHERAVTLKGATKKKLNALLEAEDRVKDKAVYDRLQQVRRDLMSVSSELSGIKLAARYVKDSGGEKAASDIEKKLDDIRHFIFSIAEPSSKTAF